MEYFKSFLEKNKLEYSILCDNIFCIELKKVIKA